MDSSKSIAPFRPAPPELPPTLERGRAYVSEAYSNAAIAHTNLWEYWRILNKRRWVVLATMTIVLTMVTLATLRMTPLFEAVTRIAILRQNNDGLGFKDSIGNQQAEDYDYTVALDTETKILQSDVLALQVIKNLKLDKNPAFTRGIAIKKSELGDPLGALQPDSVQEAKFLAAFRKNLSVAKIPHTRLIEIRYLSPDPRLAAQICNALATIYIELNFKTKFESTMQASEWLSKQLSDLEMKVQTSQEQLVRYQKEHGIVGLDEKQNIITSKLSDLNNNATAAQAERIQKEANYLMAASGNPELVSRMDPQSAMERLRTQENDLASQYAQATTNFGPSYPKVQELQNQLKQVQSAIQAETRRIAERYKTEYRAAVQKERMLTTALESQKQAANRLNESAIQYNLLKREADSNRQLYDGLLAKMKEAGISAGLRSNNIRIVDIARVPLKKTKPNVPFNIAMGLLMGLTGGIGLAFTLESLDNTVRSPEQVEIVASLPSLGIIPLTIEGKLDSNRADERKLTLSSVTKDPVGTIAMSRPKSEIAESFRALRTSILLSSLGAPPRVIMVTSGLPREGKTTTSINTAIVLAQKGCKVLLIDGDLRRPSIHEYLGVTSARGLSTLLTGSDIENAIFPMPKLPNLFVLPAGPIPPHPAELLGSSVMRNHLARWREEYDHVVIDTPPVLSVTDAVLLSVEADAVLLVIRSGKTTKEALRRSRDLLLQVNAKLMGVVVNAVDLRSPDSYYYYYGSKYGGRYYEESAHHQG